MKLQDLHVHTTYSDGVNTPEEMILAALEKNMTTLGFSDHSHTAFDQRFCMKAGAEAAYRREIAALKEKYRDRIEILCGIEQDYCSEAPAQGYDYVIGSVHYLKVNDAYFPVDEDAVTLLTSADRYFGGDLYALAEVYFRTVAKVVEKTGATLIGHFDLVSKFNEQTPMFDEHHPRYEAAWKEAADTLLKTGVPFEINTGAISRGYKTIPYPAPEIQKYIRDRGGKFILTGDSHSARTLCYAFEKFSSCLE